MIERRPTHPIELKKDMRATKEKKAGDDEDLDYFPNKEHMTPWELWDKEEESFGPRHCRAQRAPRRPRLQMVKTRRKSKAAAAAAAAAAAEHEHETASTQGTEDFSLSAPPSSTTFLVPIPPDLDLDTLSHILPDVSFAKPDPETVLSVYRLLLAQVADQDDTRRDLEELRAEVERKDIELDQAIQDGETKTKDLEVAVESLQKEVSVIKQERDQLGVSPHTFHAPNM